MKHIIASLLCICMLLSSVPAWQAAANDYDTERISAGSAQSISVTLSVSGHAGESLLAPREVEGISAGASVLEVVTGVLEESGISYTLKGNYISEIGGLSEFDYGKYSGWMYTVSGKYPTVPMGEYKLGGGESIALIYVESYVPDVKTDIASATVSGITAKYYNAKAQVQKLVLSCNGKTLTQNTDYTVTYQNNVKVGTATLTIKGCGQYEGSLTRTFSIVLAKPKVKVAAVSASALKLAWNKVPGAQYYRVYEYRAGGTFTPLAKTTAGAVVLQAGAAGSAHFYFVKACFVNKAGAECSSPVAVKDCIKAVLLCRTPTLKAAVSGKTVALRWTKSAGAKFYRVYEYNAKTKRYMLKFTSTTACSAAFGKQARGVHRYLVRAFNTAGQGSACTASALRKVTIK
ncbi:MAG: DUF4430 domain-containing protein [Clostridia bacterium]|nr:DUF4430 domain-containing protein [Clostridia bacterium]